MSRRARSLAAVIAASVFLGLITFQPTTKAGTVALNYQIFLPGIVKVPNQTALPPTPESEVVNLINIQRRANNCPALQSSPQLALAAERHSQDMADHNFFSHTGSNGSNFSQRAQAAGYPYFPSGEIIAAGQSTPADAVNAWMNSSGHRGIILNCANDDIGVGMVQKAGSTYGYYWTADFGQR